jgi:hypothetical protein
MRKILVLASIKITKRRAMQETPRETESPEQNLSYGGESEHRRPSRIARTPTEFLAD